MLFNRLSAHVVGWLMCASAWAWAGSAHAQNVFVCEPEWGALVRIFWPQAKIFVATHSQQDPHHIEARPALIAQLRNVDLAVCNGAELEVGWLPMLQRRAANPKVQEGALGMFYAADHVKLLDAKPGLVTSPWAGDVHKGGNPHVHAHPQQIAVVARALSNRLQMLDPAQSVMVAKRQAEFELAWAARVEAWERRAATLRGREVVAQHSNLAYLWEWLGMKQVADLEPQPGMAPTPGHLHRLLEQLRSRRPFAVVVSSYQDPRAGRWLVNQLGSPLPLLVLPATVSDAHAPDALGLWMDGLIDALLSAERG